MITKLKSKGTYRPRSKLTKRKIGKGTRKSKSKSKIFSGKLTKGKLSKMLRKAVKNSKGQSKIQSNLASKIINMSSNGSIVSSHSKAQQSEYTSLTINGKTKEYGQTISTDSNKPYINAAKLTNGKINIYRIPRQ